MGKREEKIKEMYNKRPVRKFFVKHPIMLAFLFFTILACFLSLFVNVFDNVDTETVYIIIVILLGVFFITLLVLMLFKNKEESREKTETYVYCNYCGEKVKTGNKYHCNCLMDKYKGDEKA